MLQVGTAPSASGARAPLADIASHFQIHAKRWAVGFGNAYYLNSPTLKPAITVTQLNEVFYFGVKFWVSIESARTLWGI